MNRRAAIGPGSVLLLALVILCAVPAPPAAGRDFTIGVTDGTYDDANRDPWLDRTVASGGSIVRFDADWPSIAPRNPAAGFDPTNPGDPAYDFGSTDASVRAARGRGLQVLLLIGLAPSWAEGPGRAASAAPGTWRPDPAALGQFSGALARRYSGSYPDPAVPGATLPRVRYFQVWNEPNLYGDLAPQWVRRGSGFVADAPGHYRLMLNAAYDAIKRAQPGALVVTGGTAPFGDRNDGGDRMQPARFVREMLCISARLRPLPCSNPARFDVLDHHPYSFGGPRQGAYGPDEVSVPDLWRLERPLRVAERTGRALPAGSKRLWVTEIAWDSSPPDPLGVPAATHASWLEDAFYLLWTQGVDTVFWFQIRDELPRPSYAATTQGGLYLEDGTPKRAQQAFRFPFVTRRTGRRSVRAWGVAPARGKVRIQRLVNGHWVGARTLTGGSNRQFVTSLKLRGQATLRALNGGLSSLTWHQR